MVCKSTADPRSPYNLSSHSGGHFTSFLTSSPQLHKFTHCLRLPLPRGSRSARSLNEKPTGRAARADTDWDPGDTAGPGGDDRSRCAPRRLPGVSNIPTERSPKGKFQWGTPYGQMTVRDTPQSRAARLRRAAAAAAAIERAPPLARNRAFTRVG